MLASTCVHHQQRHLTHLFYIVQYFLQLFPDHYKQKKKDHPLWVAFIFCVVWQREKESNLRHAAWKAKLDARTCRFVSSITTIITYILRKSSVSANIFTLTFLCTLTPVYLPLLYSLQQILLCLGDMVDKHHQHCIPTRFLLQRFQFPY